MSIFIVLDEYMERLQAEIKSQSHLGQELFVKASGKCFASVTAQAAEIARMCRTEKLGDPYILGQKFLASMSLLHTALTFANNAHRAHEIPEITLDGLRRIVSADFANASEVFMGTSLKELEYITGELFQKFPHRGYDDEKVFSSVVGHYLRTGKDM